MTSRFLILVSCLSLIFTYQIPDGKPHKFDFAGNEFQLDGQPFQFVGCELHYPRIPSAYWEHRLLMSKALGCNVISAYVFWNFHEQERGEFDFASDNKNLRGFIQLAAKHGMWVFIRPGPYVCAEWDAGGHPWWLMKEKMELRSTDPAYVDHVRKYVNFLGMILYPLQVEQGGNILLLQIENEYGYISVDNAWPAMLKNLWDQTPLTLKYYAADPYTGVRKTHLPGVAIGINPGIQEMFYNLARLVDANVPIFSAETWWGWYTHWGDKEWGVKDVDLTLRQAQYLISHKYSFSIYMAHGGTSFGFWAGANYNSAYSPDVTSYDYDCAINEAGQPTERYHKLRAMIKEYVSWDVPEIPAPMDFIEISEFVLQPYVNFGSALLYQGQNSTQPTTFEHLNQQFGLVQYTSDVGPIAADTILSLVVHDYAQIYINDDYVGTVERRLSENSITIKKAYNQQSNKITILVEAMGRINFGQKIYDPKGLIGSVYLNNNEVTGWSHLCAPLDHVSNLSTSQLQTQTPFIGNFYKANIELQVVGDTYLDMEHWGKGYVWVNGMNLGRFWEIGPQTRLYCPAPFLKVGQNEIVVLDLMAQKATTMRGVIQLKQTTTSVDL